MESTFFKGLIHPADRKIILQFLCEQRIACFFVFQPKAHNFFASNYPAYYGSVESGSQLLTAEGQLHLLGEILRAPNGSVVVQKKSIWSGDGTTHSHLVDYTCPIHPDGIVLEFPSNLIMTISTAALR